MPLPALTWQEETGDQAVYDRLLRAVGRLGIMVEERRDLPDGVHGLSSGHGLILLRLQDTVGMKTTTALHEIGHELCHGPKERQLFTREQLECQAESISWVCCQALGIPSPNSQSYLAIYGVTKAVLLANLEAIKRGATKVLRALEQEGGRS